MLLFHGPHSNLVHLVAGQVDHYMPVREQVLPPEQKGVHHHRVTARLLQRRHSLSTNTRYVRCSFLLRGEMLDHDDLFAWMFVSTCLALGVCIVTDLIQAALLSPLFESIAP